MYFITLVAIINIGSTLWMIIIEKRKDYGILSSIGLSNKNLNSIKRPISAVADNIEFRNAKTISIKINNKLRNLINKKFKTKKINVLLSISDESRHSIAFVILEKK